MTIQIPNNWRPRPDQMPLWSYLERGGTRAVEVAHRRWGKDDVALHYTATRMMQRPGNYWHMLPAYSQARKVVWGAVNPRTGKKRIDEAFPREIRANTREQEMLIETKTGATWQLVGSDNYDSLVGSPPLGIVFSEWAIANPMAWAYLSPILEENGGWALFIYTSRGNNHGKTMYQHARNTDGWFAQLLTAEQTPVFSQPQLETILRDYMEIFGPEQGEALFNQEYLCSFEGAQYGAYYAKQMAAARKDVRITAVPHATGHEVHTAWDLGVDDSMTIWFFQQVGREYRFIDYYEASGYGLEHYAKVLKDKPYVYGNHYMPHDAEQREMTNSEIARSRREVAEDLGIRPVVVVSRVKNIETLIQVHIPAVRNVIAQCWFDERRCSQGIMALESYQAEYDEEKKKLKNRPLHNWCSHGADAFRTFAVGYQPIEKIEQAEKRRAYYEGSAGTAWMGN
ncbi:MAG: hypothetical protein ABFE01_22510 [Phycisphaerales bacterium]